MIKTIKDKILSYLPKQKITRKILSREIKRAYQASQPDDNFKSIPKSLSPNSATQTASEKMRDQARWLDENHDLSIGVLDTLVGKIIGTGIKITPTVKTMDGDLDEETNKIIANLWKQFEEKPEVTAQLSMAQADRILCRTWLRDGEGLQRFIYGNVSGVEHNSPVPLSFELIEPDYLPFLKNEQKGKNTTIQGITVNQWGKPLLYNILKNNPFDLYPSISGYGMDTFAVLASDVSHIKFTRRISQVRGVTIFHGVIRRMESIKDYEENEEIAARVASNMTGFIKKDIELGQGADEGGEPRDLQMSAGMIFELGAGEDVGTISSDRPNTGLLDFRNAMLRAVASGTMTNFSAISGYYDGSYSSQRQELVESKVNYDILRNTYISIIKKPLYKKYVELGLTFGLITLSPNTDPETIMDVEVNGIAIAWIDPKKEMDAFKIAKEAKFNSRHNIIRMMGLDPVEVDAEIEKDGGFDEPVLLDPTGNSDEEKTDQDDEAETKEENNKDEE